MLIVLTGKYCAGKNHTAELLSARGIPVLDADKMGYEVLETEKETIFTQFGSDLQKADGSPDRRLLGQRVFGHQEKLAKLEAIVHPAVDRLIENWIKDKKEHSHCVINAALLHKSRIFSQFDRIILVKAPFFTRFLRARRRDKLSWRELINRFASQNDFSSQYLAINAEIYIVENRGNSGLESRIYKFIEGLK